MFDLWKRNNDFMEAYEQVYARLQSSGAVVTNKAIIEELMKVPAPSYYITFDYAYKNLVKLLNVSEKGAEYRAKCRKTMRGRMLLEIAERCRVMLLADTSISMSDALTKVLCEGNASSFFITYSTALGLFKTLRRNNNRRRKQIPLEPLVASPYKA